MSFIVQSDYTPLYLNQRIEAFISWAEVSLHLLLLVFKQFIY